MQPFKLAGKAALFSAHGPHGSVGSHGLMVAKVPGAVIWHCHPAFAAKKRRL